MRIARFVSHGHVLYGALMDEPGQPFAARFARAIDGDLLGPHRVSDRIVTVERLLAPIVPSDILCIGLNYHAHANETRSSVPDHPMLFIKAGNALSDPEAPIPIPRLSSQIDYEAELVVVIGRAGKHIPRERALDHVLGYTCGNDVSSRDWQKAKHLNGGQFARGKSFDGFAPIGPWLVTRDEIDNLNALAITCRVSGETLQASNTADMIFDVPAIISSLSSTMTLRAGSVIFTGTPEGVGVARTPPRWLVPGDVVEVAIEKIGTLRNPVVGEGA